MAIGDGGGGGRGGFSPNSAGGRSAIRSRGVCLLWGLLAAIVATCHAARAADDAVDYPKRPVRIVVPLGAGGAVDVLARLLAGRLGESTGRQFIVENRPGATGSVGALVVARSPADGYTLLLTTNAALTTNLALYPKLKYGAEDFEPIRLLAVAPIAVLVNGTSTIKTAGDFIAAAKQSGGLSVATTGNGSIGHFLINEMRRKLGANFVHVPYKGGVPGGTAIASGETQAGMLDLGAVLPFLRDQRIRALGVVGERRATALPDTPTLAEIGLPGGEIIAWACLVAPKGTPKAIIDKLGAAIGREINDKIVAERIVTAGMEPVRDSSPEQFATFLKAEIVRWRDRVVDAGLKLE